MKKIVLECDWGLRRRGKSGEGISEEVLFVLRPEQ